MNSTIIEPINLSFNLNYDIKSFKDEEEEKKAFLQFVNKLSILFDFLDKNNLKIALNSEINQLIFNIPGSVYNSENKSLLNLAQSRFTVSLSKLGKIIDSRDTSSISIESKISSEIKLIESEEYICWLKLLPLIKEKIVLPGIIKGDKISLFDTENIIVNIDKQKFPIQVFTISDSFFKSYLRLLNFKKTKPSEITTVKYFSTGTHDSMWANKIRNNKDLPLLVRDLFFDLERIGILMEVKFLDFYGGAKATTPPILELKSLDSPNTISAILKAQGIKQNAQKIQLSFIQDTATDFFNVFHKINFSKDTYARFF